jgi:hypothetical protein
MLDEKTEQAGIRFLTKLKKTTTKTLLSEVYVVNDRVTYSILTKLLQGMLQDLECL